ncbi:peptide ABC transporter [Streptomyces mangrovisoli]|uniref:Peptide ABC transporter n=2 Tax=Streptomyces mangrovisoli TaxID=1428628 RepID=A0A1J4NT12_9ACTN|nr:peptide ABC transporter [Streptomyces mangrovisoli]
MLLVTLAIVVLMASAPGSVAEVILGQNATKANVAALNKELGVDKPVFEQYTQWLSHALRGDLGTSPLTHQSVTTAIAERLPVTLELTVLAVLMALVLAVVFAVACASWPGSPLDRALTAVSSVFLSVPAFIAGPVLIYFLSVRLGWFPVMGWTPIGAGFGENLRAAIMPSLSIALVEIAAFHRLLRTDLIGTLGEDFIGAARARGMSRAYVMFRHAFRPSSLSLVTMVGLSIGRLVGATAVAETLFSLPGLGQLLITSIGSRDVVMVQGMVAFTGIVCVAVNTLADIGYGVVDPRVRRVAAA